MELLAYNFEQALLKKYASAKYKGAKVLTRTGIAEIFTEDVLGLDAPHII
jgi:hypothetical protein